MNESGTAKIGRPRQIYTGEAKTNYVSLKTKRFIQKAA